MKVKKLVLLTLLVAMFSASVAVAAENYVRKVDNFFILVDRSGSMDEKYVGTKETKIVLAKSLLERMNAMIPELGYQGALTGCKSPPIFSMPSTTGSSPSPRPRSCRASAGRGARNSR